MALTIAQYWQQPNVVRILCVEVMPLVGATLYLSDRPYTSELGQVFNPIVAKVPRIHRSAQGSPLPSKAVSSYGELLLIEDIGDMRGAAVNIKLVAPSPYLYSEADPVLLNGYIDQCKASLDAGWSYVVKSGRAGFDNKTLQLYRFNQAVESASFPTELHDTLRPVVYGVVKNIPTTLVDAANNIYEVSANPLLSGAPFQLYDNGVPVLSTPVFGVGRYQLNAPPVGEVTARCTAQNNLGVMQELLADAGIVAADIAMLDTFINSVYVSDGAKVSYVLNELASGSLSCWGFNHLGQFFLKRWSGVQASALTLNADDVVGDVSWWQAGVIAGHTELRFNHNYAPLAVVATSSAEATYFKSNHDTVVLKNMTVFPYAEDVALDFSGDAMAASSLVQDIVSLLEKQRWFCRLTLPILGVHLNVADVISMPEFFSNQSNFIDWKVVSISEDYSGDMPTMTVECFV